MLEISWCSSCATGNLGHPMLVEHPLVSWWWSALTFVFVTTSSHARLCTFKARLAWGGGKKWHWGMSECHAGLHIPLNFSFEMALLWKSCNSLIIFLFCFFFLWCWAQAEWLLSAPVWATAHLNPGCPSLWHPGHVLLCARLCMDTSEERVCVPKMLQSQFES